MQSVVFSKSWCPFCKASKDLLAEFGAKINAVELDELCMSLPLSLQRGKKLMVDGLPADGSDIQSALQEMTSQRTVPNIFIGQKHIGGNSELQAKKAELPAMLKAAGAL